MTIETTGDRHGAAALVQRWMARATGDALRARRRSVVVRLFFTPLAGLLRAPPGKRPHMTDNT